ncbi:MAG: ATP-binding cassette domain-containing protein [Nitriliruptoraceae bacterium]
MTSQLLEVQDLSLRRDDRQILSHIDLTVEPGEIHGLVGANGSGKSSLAYAVMGCSEYVPDEGHISFTGQDVTRAGMTVRARLGMTLAWQEPARFEGLTVAHYLQLGAPGSPADALDAALEAVGLKPSAYRHRAVDQTLSGGERKRIELAAVVAMRPRLTILDEPDSGVDVLTVENIAVLIRRLADVDSSVLLITHRDDTLAVVDTASLLCQGRVVAEGPPADVRAHYQRGTS